MTKEEKIKEAYGKYWELVKDLVRPDGSLSEAVWMGSGMEMIPYQDYSTGYLRPLSLVGIEDNNGWIKIESESDLPKEKFNYSFVYCLKPEIISSVQNNIVRNDQLEELFEDEWITHYKPVSEPTTPIY